MDIVIVNWNSGEQLYNCLSSIKKADKNAVDLSHVVVVDNGSTDGSVDTITKVDLPLEIIRNKENHGFAYASNQGAQYGEARYILFLNPDTELEKDTLDTAAKYIESATEQVGIVGVQQRNENGVYQSCNRFATPLRLVATSTGIDKLFPAFGYEMEEWSHDQTRTVDHVQGSFFLVRRDLFEDLGGFDENFFVYYEDMDFSLRAAQRGWKTRFLADTSIYHRAGGTSEQIKGIRLYHSLTSRARFALKHYRLSIVVVILLLMVSWELMARLFLAVGSGSIAEIRDTVVGYRRFIAKIPHLVWQTVSNK